LPLEYAIRSCDVAIIKLLLSLNASANPSDMLKIAVCRGDLNILAQVLVNLIENSHLQMISEAHEVITLAI